MRKGRKTKLSWPDADTQFLVDNYRTMSYPAIAKQLGRNPSAVQSRSFAMGLKRTKEEQHAISLKYNTGMIKKGAASWNKGMKGLQLGGEKGYFPKGHEPANTKHDGATSIRKDQRGIPYWHIRIAKGKWEYLHRYLWQKQNGPIEKGQILRCKSSDTLNTNLDNWYLTDRKKHMAKNSGPLRLPDTYVAATLTVRKPELRKELMKHPELLEVARKNMQLKREINKQRLS